MMTKQQAIEQALTYFAKASIKITEEEKTRIEIADFGLNDLENIGLEILTYVNTDRCCAKELVLFPNQACPEHRHPSVDGKPGKEETFRCRMGRVELYLNRSETPIVLNEGEQYTLPPDTLHWFKTDENGAVISEFSTSSTDENDIFTDQRIVR